VQRKTKQNIFNFETCEIRTSCEISAPLLVPNNNFLGAVYSVTQGVEDTFRLGALSVGSKSVLDFTCFTL
jgi:hypothetical protein